MDLQSLADFIQQQREQLENEKRELLLRKIPPPDPHLHCQDQDGVVPALIYEDNVDADDSFDQPEQSGKQPSQHPDMFHSRAALLERRAATAGEKVPQSTVSESFYSFFPSFNEDKQQKLEVRRQEYFEYLKQIKTSSPTMTTTPRCELPTLDGSLDEQRRMEKDRLAAQFQKSKQKSILNYQIVEARNQRAEEEAQRKKQEYHDELKMQIEEQRRRSEARKTMDKLEDELLNRKLELEELHANEQVIAPPPPAYRQIIQTEQSHRKTQSDMGLERRTTEMNSHVDICTNSARDHPPGPSREMLRHPPPPHSSHKPCCDNYKLILDKLETLCRWRDDFVAKKKNNRRNGCLLCDSGNLKNCNFCDYHETIIRDVDRFEESITDSESDLGVSTGRKHPRNNLRMITDSFADRPTPKAVPYKPPGRTRDVEEEEKENSFETVQREDTRNSFINFDDIPLPTQRKRGELFERKRPVEESAPIMTSSRMRLNEMKKVEWKWDIPAVQKHSIDKGKSRSTKLDEHLDERDYRDSPKLPQGRFTIEGKSLKVLTQLGAIRKQLQMEQLRME